MQAARPRVVVVTGASAGIGRATARAFAATGAAVGLIARGRDGLDGARREIEQAGGRALVLVYDVADAAQVEAAAERVETELGPIDVWVNVAMVTVFGPVHTIEAADFRRVTEVTYLGTVHGTLAALKRMRRAARAASSRSARRWPTARSRSSRPIAPPRQRSAASPIRCAAN